MMVTIERNREERCHACLRKYEQFKFLYRIDGIQGCYCMQCACKIVAKLKRAEKEVANDN